MRGLFVVCILKLKTARLIKTKKSRCFCSPLGDEIKRKKNAEKEETGKKMMTVVIVKRKTDAADTCKPKANQIR